MAAFESLIDPRYQGGSDVAAAVDIEVDSRLDRGVAGEWTPGQRDFVVRRLLRERGYSLQANVKTAEGGQHADRDAQFEYLNVQANAHLACGDPVISVDTKKKELVGAYKNGGRHYVALRKDPIILRKDNNRDFGRY